MKFTIPLEPTGQMRARHGVVNGHARTYKHAKQEGRENKFLAFAVQHAPEEPIKSALDVTINAYMPIPKSMPKKARELAISGAIRPAKKPDPDNIGKHALDCMNGIFWDDDRQIVGLTVRKFYSENPRWEIEILEAV